jgi:predicted DNA-binding antitoxin AbrB/MazE fold protein
MLKKRKEKTTFKIELREGDKVRIVLTGFHKKSEGQFSDEVYTV